MAIYDIFETEKKAETAPPEQKQEAPAAPSGSDRFFSCVAARAFFILLFVADLVWCLYSLSGLIVSGLVTLLTGCKISLTKRLSQKFWISIKRSLVCGLSLIIALLSPAFGIMVACTYFLMYDKAGLTEVVPSSIQSQFTDLFNNSKQ
jgi:hypothetical protein